MHLCVYVGQKKKNCAYVNNKASIRGHQTKTEIYLSKKKKKKKKRELNTNKVEKEEEKAQVGELSSGINLQGLCSKHECLAAKTHLPVWVNVGFKESLLLNEFSIRIINGSNSDNKDNKSVIQDNRHQCTYSIKFGVSYELQATKIKQHTKVLGELILKSQKAMDSDEMKNLVKTLRQYHIIVVQPKLKGEERLNEKIEHEYAKNCDEMFDIGRFTILCKNKHQLETAVTVLKKAKDFGMIVSKDKDCFNKQSETHHRFHNITLFVPKYDVYIEMQATLENFTTLKGHSIIENPELSHLYYENIRTWKTNNSEDDDLKQASDETLTKINDIICEWTEERNITRIAARYRKYLNEGILEPLQLKGKTEEDVKNSIPLKMAQFTYSQLCQFKPPTTLKGKAVFMVLYDYYKKYIIGEDKPVNCSDIAAILQDARIEEIEKEDIVSSQALLTYVPLQANYEQFSEQEKKGGDAFDCHKHVLEFLEKKSEIKQVMIIQGKSGSGKSLYGCYLEEYLWECFTNQNETTQQQIIPVFISLPKFYNMNIDESQLIYQILQSKSKYIHKDIIDAVRHKLQFVFILDGFDEIFDLYNKHNDNFNKYFYDRFKLNEWNAKVIVICRSNVLSEMDIKKMLVGNNNNTSKIYLWPFSTRQIDDYITKFVNMQQNIRDKTKDKKENWTANQYKETLDKYPNFYKMIQEPFLLRLILTVLPLLSKKHDIGANISKVQVYDVFLHQWIDEHVQNISKKLNELKIITNKEELKCSFQTYCEDLAFDMFLQNEQVVTDNEIIFDNSTLLYSNVNSIINFDICDHDMKQEKKSNEENKENTIEMTRKNDKGDVWKKYFKAGNINKFALRRIGANQYTFLHKSCQEYYAAQKILFDIILWEPNVETHAQLLLISKKLLNEEMGIIQFIADRIYDNNLMFVNLKSRLFRLIELSKDNLKVSTAAANAATILNVARISMSYQNWDNINISKAILDHAFLEGTSFKDAILNGVSFYNAYLNYTDFTNASVNQINFGTYGYLKGHSDNVNSVQFSPDGNRIVSGSTDGTIRLWDASSGKQLQLLKGHLSSVYFVQFSPDGDKIVSGSRDTTIRLWDASSGKQIQSLEGHSGSVTSVQFSRDGNRIVSGSEDKTIRLWDASSGKQIQLLEGHLFPVYSVQFSPDGSRIVSGSLDRIIRLWDASSGKQIQSLKGHSDSINSVQFSPNGDKIVSGSGDKTIRLWDVLSGKQIQSLKGHSDHITSVQFSDDNRIVSGSWDKTIRLWDASSGKQIQSLEGHSHK
ncbi:hypothetical protein RFI_21722, partial [Reticulomyxa filosa]